MVSSARFKMAGVRRKRSQKMKRVNSTCPGRKLKKKGKIKVNIESKTIRKAWDKSKTLKQNFMSLGLAYNINKLTSEENKDDDSMEIDKKPISSTIKGLEEEASHCMKKERHFSPGEAKFIWELIQDHGDNYEAMKKDKRNFMQHTAKQLRRKCLKFLSSSQNFANDMES
ncbi:nucleolar protein 16-like [Xenia sp. Carnegie-2017]|uniref:nucleolar protein 16-like n=1 Tax=Xenia sp. Carnegie-2017 TaxID=2897299 RepID=UPI001F036741|nr:nucleolar protein 16-like [Xenia sp. Carnegie-2017]